MSRPPLSDSPWFWAYLFATAAIVGLALINPKFERRQAQIERQYQGRSRAEQVKKGQTPNVELSTPGDTRWNLRPLYGTLAVVAVIGWIFVWQRSLRVSPEAEAEINSVAEPPSR